MYNTCARETYQLQTIEKGPQRGGRLCVAVNARELHEEAASISTAFLLLRVLYRSARDARLCCHSTQMPQSCKARKRAMLQKGMDIKSIECFEIRCPQQLAAFSNRPTFTAAECV
jgi:hypothetical protein